MKPLLTIFCLCAFQIVTQAFVVYWTPPLGIGDTNKYTYTVWIGSASGVYSQNYVTTSTNLTLPQSALSKIPAKNYLVVSAVSDNQSATNSDGSFNLFDPSQEIVVLRQGSQILRVK